MSTYTIKYFYETCMDKKEIKADSFELNGMTARFYKEKKEEVFAMRKPIFWIWEFKTITRKILIAQFECVKAVYLKSNFEN